MPQSLLWRTGVRPILRGQPLCLCFSIFLRTCPFLVVCCVAGLNFLRCRPWTVHGSKWPGPGGGGQGVSLKDRSRVVLLYYRPDTAAQREKSLVEPGIFHVIFQCINRSKTRHTFWAHFRHLFPNTFKHNHTPPYNTNHHTKSYTVYINVVLVNFGKKNIFFRP